MDGPAPRQCQLGQAAQGTDLPWALQELCVDKEILAAPRGFSSTTTTVSTVSAFPPPAAAAEERAGSIPQGLCVVMEVCLCAPAFCYVSCHGALMEAETLSPLIVGEDFMCNLDITALTTIKEISVGNTRLRVPSILNL